MSTSQQHTGYACHRLIDEYGEVHASSIVRLTHDGHVVGHIPFNHEEQPFTQWLGGTILLTPEAQPPLASGECLDDYLCQRANLPGATPQSPAPLYAWHTSFVDRETPLTHPPTLLPFHKS